MAKSGAPSNQRSLTKAARRGVATPLTELAEQVEKIVGDAFTKGIVIDRAKRAADITW